jgi:1,4-alpha-glucan branching enzyme
VPAGANDGVTFINSGKSAIFNLYAPNKTSVSVIGDFNNWQPTAMTKSTDGTRWWVQVDNIDPTKEYAYQYYIDNTIKVADPYTEKVLDPDNDNAIPATVYPNLLAYPAGKTTGIVSVMQASPTAYSWKNASITRPDPKNLVIYELHVRDFIGTHSYKTLTDTLNYIANLGVNAVELMPVNELKAMTPGDIILTSVWHSINIMAPKMITKPLLMPAMLKASP